MGGKNVEILAHLRSALVLLAVFTLITGITYPLVVTALAQLIYPVQANGSIIIEGEDAIGSELIGQPFTAPKYFWGRPSATQPFPYNAAASSGSNLAPSNPALTQAVKERVDILRNDGPLNRNKVPVDMVTASGSGLDPHISVAAALYQVPRIARARGLPDKLVRDLITELTETRQFGILGEPRVNVLKINLALDEMDVK